MAIFRVGALVAVKKTALSTKETEDSQCITEVAENTNNWEAEITQNAKLRLEIPGC